MGAVSRRACATCLMSLLLVLLSACEKPRESSLDPVLWEDFQQRFVRDGRVVDTGNDDISHSEGQGYGMLLAVAADDRTGFAELWQWTARVLQREDGLLSWRYTPCPQADTRCVTDHNNASDGDLLVAWALLRAHDAWGKADYLAAAERILAAAEQQLVVEQQGYVLLLPGAVGFRHGDAVTVNLSYWVFPALEAFQRKRPDAPWQALRESGIALIDAARFGTAELPPDWLELDDDGLRPSPRFPARYGFEAGRIPLYMTWAGMTPADDWQAFERLWQRDPVPAWIDLADGSTAEYAWSRGMASIAELPGSEFDGAKPEWAPISSEGGHDPMDYYGHVLLLLTHLAAAEPSR